MTQSAPVIFMVGFSVPALCSIFQCKLNWSQQSTLDSRNVPSMTPMNVFTETVEALMWISSVQMADEFDK